MIEYMHKQMTNWACLSAGKRYPVWLEDMEGTGEASVYPDLCTAGESDPNSGSWDPLWRPLIMVPQSDGTKRPIHSLIHTQQLRQSYPALLRYEAGLSVSAFRQGNRELGRKAAGIISHIIGDTVQAAHTTDTILVNWMYAQPDKKYNMHGFMERVISPLPYEEEYEPRILGDMETFVWRLTEELAIALRKSIAEIPILMDGLLHHNREQAEASAKRSALLGCRLIADAMATISAITEGKPNIDRVISLTQLLPSSCEVDSIFNYEPMVDFLPGQSYDTTIPLDIGEGTTSGICLLPMMAGGYREVRKSFATFALPGSQYTSFSAKIGLQHFSPGSAPFLNETPAIFEVRLDGNTVYRSGPVDSTMPPQEIIIPLGTARELSLYARDVREPDPVTKFVYPVFAEPRIFITEAGN